VRQEPAEHGKKRLREIRVGTLGPSLADRERGAALRRQIESALRDPGQVALDFTGVRLVGPAFTRECFFKLARMLPPGDLRRRLRVRGATPLVASSIRYSLGSVAPPAGVQAADP
jgi:hypothetical protein